MEGSFFFSVFFWENSGGVSRGERLCCPSALSRSRMVSRVWREMVFVLMAVVLSTASRSFECPQTSFFSSPPLNIFENMAKAFDSWPGQGGYSSEWQEAKIGSGFASFLSSFDVDTKIPELSLHKQPRGESWDFSLCPPPLCVCLSVSCHRMRKVSPLSLSLFLLNILIRSSERSLSLLPSRHSMGASQIPVKELT